MTQYSAFLIVLTAFWCFYPLARGIPFIFPTDPTNSFYTNPFLQETYIKPLSAVNATTSNTVVADEIQSWIMLSVLTRILSQYQEVHYYFSEENDNTDFLIFAPTNLAFIKLFRRRSALHDFNETGKHDGSTLLEQFLDVFEHFPEVAKTILQSHIIEGDWTEADIVGAKELVSVSGAVLNTSNFPKISIDTSNTSATRIYRPIVMRGRVTARLAFTDEVLLPQPLERLLMLDVETETPEPLTGDGFPKPLQPYADELFSSPHGSTRYQPILKTRTIHTNNPYLPPSLYNDRHIFDSPMDLLSARTDCIIFRTLIKALPHSSKMLGKINVPLHIFVPTDKAFYATLSKEHKLEARHDVHNSIRHEIFISNLVDAIESLWLGGESPLISTFILGHFAFNAARPIHLLKGETVPTVDGEELRVSEDGLDIVVRDRGIRKSPVISSHATLKGFVTVVDGMITKFDPQIAENIWEILDTIFKRKQDSSDREPHFGAPLASPLVEDDDDNHPLQTMEPEFEDSDDSEDSEDPQGACFPGDVMLSVSGNKTVAMKNLKGGNIIKVSDSGIYSRVMAFTHRDPSRAHPYLEISFSNGMSLTLSDEHYTYVSGRLKAASAVRLGDKMKRDDGREIVVWDIRRVWATGKYAPHTIHGDLVVNGVVVSAYTTNVHPTIAHALLLPVRLVTVLTGLKEPLGSMFYRGGKQLLRYLPRGAAAY